MKKTQKTNASIALNRKAHHEYFIEERLEVGLVLEGWEVKAYALGVFSLIRVISS